MKGQADLIEKGKAKLAEIRTGWLQGEAELVVRGTELAERDRLS